VAMVEAQEAHDVVISMFLINDTSAVMLFDSGASHSFISAAYAGKHNLPLALLRCQMIVLWEEMRQEVYEVDYSKRKGNGVYRRASSHCQGCC
jgi:hypothetical protein